MCRNCRNYVIITCNHVIITCFLSDPIADPIAQCPLVLNPIAQCHLVLDPTSPISLNEFPVAQLPVAQLPVAQLPDQTRKMKPGLLLIKEKLHVN